MAALLTPYVADPDFTLYVGDVRDVLRELPDESVHCVVTSPPYWGLRDYGTGAWEGGDPECDHCPPSRQPRSERPDAHGFGTRNVLAAQDAGSTAYRSICGKCGARRVDSQLGLEPTPEEYVAAMVDVFREVRRVLRRDGTCWLVLGDSYGAANNRNGGRRRVAPTEDTERDRALAFNHGTYRPIPGLKPKDLVGIPWRVAQALQAPYYTGKIKDERDRIWLAATIEAEGCLFLHKRKEGQSNGQGYVRKNATYGAGLEVSSTDRVIVERCLAITGLGSICEQTPAQNERRKQTIYRWNLRSNVCRDVIRELYPHLIAKQHEARLLLGCPSSGPKAEAAHESLKAIHQGAAPSIDFAAPESMLEAGWYLRSDVIWSKKPNPMPESVTDRPTKSHEYVFLLTRSPRYYFDQEAVREPHAGLPGGRFGTYPNGTGRQDSERPRPADNPAGRNIRSVWEIATQPYPEAHFATYPEALVERCVKAGCPEGGTVLDPFLGSGTTAQVARRLGRHSIGIELSEEYAKLAARRLSQLSLLAEASA